MPSKSITKVAGGLASGFGSAAAGAASPFLARVFVQFLIDVLSRFFRFNARRCAFRLGCLVWFCDGHFIALRRERMLNILAQSEGADASVAVGRS